MTAATAAAANGKEKLIAALAHPLIVGASVSGDTSSLSPGRKLALRYHPAPDIRAVAKGGTPGVELLQAVDASTFAGRSSVIALDLFFWDSAFPDPKQSVAALKKFMGEVKGAGLPVVLGEIPELLRGHQPGRPALNAALKEACEAYPSCALMPFDRLHKKLVGQGYLEIGGRRRTIREIVPDGLHLADFAGDYLANVLEETITPKW